MNPKMNDTQLNYEVVTDIIPEGVRVLDLGCGDGTLFSKLAHEKKITGVGIEINQDEVIKALDKGVSVIQGDIDEGLKQFPDNSFDYAILNQTLQSTEKPDLVVDEMLRVAKKAVVSFPNFAYWKVRFYLFFKGKMPKSKALPYEWYNTPNIHLMTVNDFFEFCKNRNIKILKSVYLTKNKARSGILVRAITNFFSEEVVFVVSK
ncbi:MAG: methionine biosynthesis protein MetW [Candidatus Gastranaerophilales bacterium]|nr:methionine biosynthesis protein MetW [Candidatus Gastranaerophilales bacterium]